MQQSRTSESLLCPLLALLSLPLSAQAEITLWQIGRIDNDTAEFAMAPDKIKQYPLRFGHDVFFVVAESDPKQDWPYIQPGPADSWAGSKTLAEQGRLKYRVFVLAPLALSGLVW